MVKPEPFPFAVGDVVRLKKPHPCGGYAWTVVRLGADIGVKCQTCGRRVLLPRRELERRLKQIVVHVSDDALSPTDGDSLSGVSIAGETGS